MLRRPGIIPHPAGPAEAPARSIVEGRRVEREVDDEGRPAAELGFHGEPTSVPIDDPVGEGEAEPRSHAGALGGKSGIEYFRKVVGIDSPAVVAVALSLWGGLSPP